MGIFKLELFFVNAFFPNQTEMPYELVGDSGVVVNFSLHKGEAQEKKIYFSIPETMKSFKINLKCEKVSLFLRSNPKYPTELIYSWFDEKFIFIRNVLL